jgi:hypothetical protein
VEVYVDVGSSVAVAVGGGGVGVAVGSDVAVNEASTGSEVWVR